MTSSDDHRGEARYRAVSIGSAATCELSAPGVALRVHSTFASSVNLEASGSGRLIALSGPSGWVYPHAVVLECSVDFRTWGLERGSSARVTEGSIRMDGGLTVDLKDARRRLPRSFPRIDRFTSICRSCASRLTKIQDGMQFDLTLDALLDLRRPVTKEGETLRQAAIALGASARLVQFPERARGAVTDMRLSVSSLVGLGAGLTPTGDDFLGGFMAAVRARFGGEFEAGASLLGELCAAVEENLASTGDISASLLRYTIRNYWPEPLLNLADAIAADRQFEALQALEDLCRLGHSSGADIATGFLFGLRALPGRCRGQSPSVTRPPLNRGSGIPGPATKPGMVPHERRSNA
jgi:hypothetical protein